MSVILAGSSLIHIAVALRQTAPIGSDPRLLALLPANTHASNMYGTVPDLDGFACLSIEAHGPTLHHPFEPARAIATTVDVIKTPGALLTNSTLQSYCRGILGQARELAYILIDPRDYLSDLYLLFGSKALHDALPNGTPTPDPDDWLRKNLDEMLSVWCENVAAMLIAAHDLPIRLFRFERLAGSTPDQSVRACFKNMVSSECVVEPTSYSRPLISEHFLIPGSWPKSLPVYAAERALKVCGPLLSLLERQVSSGAPLNAPDSSDVQRALEGVRLLPFGLARVLGVSLGTTQSTLVHIPARSGSTRLKDKNIASLMGMPLMAYTILLAKRLKGVDRIVINTDSEQYAEVARSFGAEAPFLRPPDLSALDSSLEGALEYCLKRLREIDGFVPSRVVTLYPTSPLRRLGRVQAMLDALDDHPLVTACAPVDVDWGRLYLPHNGTPLALSNFLKTPASRRIYKSLGYFDGRSFAAGKTGQKCFVIDDPYELLDVDTQADFDVAETILKTDGFDFGTHLCL
ncbi:MAG: hypothetical protein HY795_03500 [Desulfovibrio sp.]|nr:hypothetical protein [Desulfovibrio sp.]MBI4959118.1 hypothetical protein [Desulfovibrio sp.]